MDLREKAKMEGAFIRLREAVRVAKQATKEVEQMSIKTWGFGVADIYDERIQNTLYYGTDYISFSRFFETMEEIKKKHKETGEFL